MYFLYHCFVLLIYITVTLMCHEPQMQNKVQKKIYYDKLLNRIFYFLHF